MTTFAAQAAVLSSNLTSVIVVPDATATLPLASGALTGFSVQANGVSQTITSAARGGSIDTGVAVIQLANPVAVGSNVTVSYTPGNVADSTGGTAKTLAAFTNLKAYSAINPVRAGFDKDLTTIRLKLFNVVGVLTPSNGITGFTASVNGSSAAIASVALGANRDEVVITLAAATTASSTTTISCLTSNLTDSQGKIIFDFRNLLVNVQGETDSRELLGFGLSY